MFHMWEGEPFPPANVPSMHPATEHIMQFFAFRHLPPHLQDVSKPFHLLAATMIEQCPESPELTAGLRKLLEAKDCFVRAALPKFATGGIVKSQVYLVGE